MPSGLVVSQVTSSPDPSGLLRIRTSMAFVHRSSASQDCTQRTSKCGVYVHFSVPILCQICGGEMLTTGRKGGERANDPK